MWIVRVLIPVVRVRETVKIARHIITVTAPEPVVANNRLSNDYCRPTKKVGLFFYTPGLLSFENARINITLFGKSNILAWSIKLWLEINRKSVLFCALNAKSA